MIEPLYEHQKNILKENKAYCGIFTGTGSAKTRTALELAEGKTLVVCPKQQREDQTWQNNAKKFEIKIDLTVISKEDLKRDLYKIPYYDTIIIDECHNNFGVSPETRMRKGQEIPKTSQIFEATHYLISKNKPKRFYLCSATPVSISNPMNMWAVAKLLGHNWDFYKFRQAFFFQIRVGQRRIWMPKKDEATKERIAGLVKKFGYTGKLDDFFDVPEQTHRIVHIELTDAQNKAIKQVTENEADPLVRRARMRTIENGVLYGQKIEVISAKEDKMTKNTTIYPSRKIDYILERAQEFPKLLIFANYTVQIEEIERQLKKEGYTVSTLTGKTKDRNFMREVDAKPDPHIIVAQSSISSGYELPSFPCVIYASKSWRFVDYEQSLGRVLRSNKLKKNLYIHLVVKGCDSDCHEAIMNGQDFQEKLTLNI